MTEQPADDAATDSPLDKDQGAEAATVREEIGRIRTFLGGISLDDLRDGSWFVHLLTFSLDSYAKKVDAEYLRAKYPHLPADAVVDARVQLAARYAAIEGGLTASAYTGAIAATIGSGGGASPLTLPAAVTSFAVDLTYMSQLQLRLAYDIAVLYRVPLDLSDPEDLWKLVRVALVIKTNEIGGQAALRGVPVIIRPLVKKIFSGATLAAAKSLPAVGKYLLQRNIIKFAIPAIGVPLATGINYWSAKIVGRHARTAFRNEARAVEIARRLSNGTNLHEDMLWAMWLVATEEGAVNEHERALLHHFTRQMEDSGDLSETLEQFQSVVEVDREAVLDRLEAAVGDRRQVFDAAVQVAAVDGKIHGSEWRLLQRVADRCGVTYDEPSIREAASRSRAR